MATQQPALADEAAANTQLQGGRLYVVSTPIGNLGDLSPRAQQILAQVDCIAAEDTRTSGTLLHAFGIKTRCVTLHQHNEAASAAGLIAQMQAGHSVALISDAGTPLVSDPGFLLVRQARAEGLQVLAVPGPSAVLAALAISGLPTDQFSFLGFLPSKAGARGRVLAQLASRPETLILYESPHRVLASVEHMAAELGAARPVCVARELTKRYEESYSGQLAGAVQWLREKPTRQKGEFVIVLGGAAAATAAETVADDDMLKVLMQVLEPSAAARTAAQLSGGSRNALYKRALQLSGSGGQSGDQGEEVA